MPGTLCTSAMAQIGGVIADLRLSHQSLRLLHDSLWERHRADSRQERRSCSGLDLGIRMRSERGAPEQRSKSVSHNWMDATAQVWFDDEEEVDCTLNGEASIARKIKATVS